MFVALTVSVGFVWLSLVASLIHNFVELYALYLDSEFEQNESVLTIYKLILEMPEIKQMPGVPGDVSKIQEILETPIKEEQLHQVLRAQRDSQVRNLDKRIRHYHVRSRLSFCRRLCSRASSKPRSA